MESSLRLISRVKLSTGKHVRLGMFERAVKASFKETEVALLVDRVWYKERRGSYTVTHTGKTLHTFTRNSHGRWDHDELTTKSEVDEMVVYTGSNYITDLEREVQAEWENMCYRPGSPADPQDSVARQNQGYRK